MFALIENATIARYPADPRADHPDTSFPADWPGGTVAGDEYTAVVATERPTFDEMTQNVAEAAPQLVDGFWTQQWSVSEASDEDKVQRLADKRAGMVCTRFQAKAALHAAGLLATVNAMMANPGADPIDVLAWQESAEFHRSSATLQRLAAALGMTDAQLDALFLAAAQIEV